MMRIEKMNKAWYVIAHTDEEEKGLSFLFKALENHYNEDITIKQLKDELEVTDRLLFERNKLLDAIPECKLHGKQCVSHALSWIKERAEK